MSKSIFFISDTHFGHANMLEFTNYDGSRLRPFDSIEELDELMIQNWNERVKPTDKIYHLGDVVYRCKNRDQIMSRLNGEKVLIKGNHDRDQLSWYMKYFKDIRGTCHIDGNYLLSHFPIHPDSKGRFVRGLHGHIHAQTVMKTYPVVTLEGYPDIEREPDPWYRNCCVEVNSYSPIPFELIKEETEKLIEDGIIIIPKKERSNKWRN
jgi:calcineurin-like phosphoesterase family protein